MENWKIILWLVLFFPIGLYFMFKYSQWSKPIKFGVSGLFALMAIIGGLEGWVSLFFLTSFAIIIMGIVMTLISFIKSKNRKKNIGVLLLGITLFSFSYQYITIQEAEQVRIEQQEQEAKKEKERLIEEEKQQEIAKKEEEKRIEEEKKLNEQIAKAIEKVNEEPTEANYLKAMDLLNQLDNSDHALVKKLEDLKPTVDEYEGQIKVASDAIERAESDLSRQTYVKASELISALSIPNRTLSNRLNKVDTQIIKIEEEKKLVEAEEAKENERIALAQKESQQQAEKEQEEQQAAQAQAQHVEQEENFPQIEEPVEEQVVDNIGQLVYVAPQSGTKYHFTPNCRGLNNANSIQEMDLYEAQGQGYDLCGWE